MSALTSAQAADRSPRHDIVLPVEFRGPDGNLKGTTINLSRGGMFLNAKRMLPKGSKVFFRFSVPANQMQFNLEGEVVWQNKRRRPSSKHPRGMGIRFVYNRVQNERILDGIFSLLNTVNS